MKFVRYLEHAVRVVGPDQVARKVFVWAVRHVSALLV